MSSIVPGLRPWGLCCHSSRHRCSSQSFSASSEGKRGIATITVNAVQPPPPPPPPPPAAVASVVLDAHDPVLEAGGTHLLSATARDSAGRELLGRTVTWSTSNAAVLTIAQDGLATAHAVGAVSITATVEGKSASARLAVDAPPGADLLYQRSLPGENELYTRSLAAPGATPVRLNAGNVSHRPSASPDGTRIVFAVSMVTLVGQVVEDIYAVDRNGMNMRQLTTAPGVDDMPAWSPVAGANQIAYVHLDPPTGRSDIWLMNADGTAQRNLTADLPADEARREPAWSPDGQWIAFASSRNAGGVGRGSIWIMRADGTQKRRLTQSPGTGFDLHPSWSSDGSRIAFARGGLAIATVATGAVTVLTFPGQLTDPVWSPDGRHVAFAWRSAQPGSGTWEIHTVRADGTDPRIRVRDGSLTASAVAPAWIRR